MRRINRISLLHLIAFVLLAFAPFCWAQNQPSNIDSASQPGPSDGPINKAAIISSAMDFSSKDAAAFWPIYQQYEAERSTLDACRSAVIQEYAEKYLTMNDEAATAMADRILDCDSRLTAVKKRYFKRFSKVLPSYTVTKFFQLDHRIDLVREMKMEASLLPRVQSESAPELR